MPSPPKPKKIPDETESEFAERTIQWSKANREYQSADKKKRRSQETPVQREKRLADARERKRQLGPEHLKASRAAYTKHNRQRENENRKRWLARQPSDYKSKHDKIYRDKNAENIKAKRSSPEYLARKNTRARNKYHCDPKNRIEKCLRAALTQALRLQRTTKTERVFSLLGCSMPKLMAHIERQFQDEMSWDNYGCGWHIDHIRPCASFDLTKLEDRQQCWHFMNLQPLWAVDNIQKNSRYDGKLFRHRERAA